MEETRSCRDCANFEDRRDIDKVAMCALHSGPHVCCEEFNPRDDSKNQYNVYNRFCSECANFEDIHGISVCARIHSPGIACGGFRSKLLESSTIQQDNLMKTTLLEYMIKENNPESMPASLLKIAKKMEW
jgi:hypothetical protein